MSSNSVFNKQILAEKLSKFNSSAASVQSLSTWCISHRKKAKLIVETWDKQFNSFNSSQKDQRVSFLYLANDILQNSRRKGSEFVNEFWKVLPAALKHVYDNGDDSRKLVVFRLTNIWEERKVFGSRGQNLKDEVLGKEPPPSLSVGNGKSSNLIKIIKRDAHAVRIKLPVGDMPEILLTAFEAVQEEHVKEEAALNNCNTAVQYVKSVEDNIEKTMSQGDQQVTALGDELQNQETILLQCVLDFETAEATRAALASKLKEALQNQESELELIRTQLQVAKSLIEQAREMKKKLTTPAPLHPPAITDTSTQAMRVMESNFSSLQQINTQQLLSEPAMSFAPNKVSEEEKTKAAAAAVAARLTASTSSAQMLSSVLSSLVAEEAAALHGGSKSAGFSSDLLGFSPLKRQKQEQSLLTSAPLPVPTTGIQHMPQSNQLQAMFAPSLPSLVSPTNPPPNQFGQANGPPMGMMPYGYGAYPTAPTLLPPPPFPPQSTVGSARPATISQHQPQHQPASNGGYYGPPGFGFYGQTHQPNSSQVARQ